VVVAGELPCRGGIRVLCVWCVWCARAGANERMNEIEIDWFGVVHTLVASLSHARRIAPPSPTLNTHTYIHTHIHTHTHTRNISSYKIEIIAIIVDGSLSLEREIIVPPRRPHRAHRRRRRRHHRDDHSNVVLNVVPWRPSSLACTMPHVTCSYDLQGPLLVSLYLSRHWLATHVCCVHISSRYRSRYQEHMLGPVSFYLGVRKCTREDIQVRVNLYCRE